MKYIELILFLFLSQFAFSQNISLGPYIQITSPNCESEQLCLPIASNLENEIDVLINGTAYTDGFTDCTATISVFTTFTIPEMGMNGPYTFTWEFNGVDYSGVFQDLDDLIVKMNEIDPAKPWFLENNFTLKSHNTMFPIGGIEYHARLHGTRTSLAWRYRSKQEG